jgi:hypothetical protein
LRIVKRVDLLEITLHKTTYSGVNYPAPSKLRGGVLPEIISGSTFKSHEKRLNVRFFIHIIEIL